jgi:hypothetical protein
VQDSNQKNAVEAITLNDIIQRKLEGIVNKLEIDATTGQDTHLAKAAQDILSLHQKIGEKLGERR